MDGQPLDLGALPAVVAGPILRRLTSSDVSVWLATTTPDPITLTVKHHSRTDIAPTTVTAVPARVGSHLWMTVLTAPAPGAQFLRSEVYSYDVTAAWPPARGIDWTKLALPGTDRPTFVVPPDDLADLVLLHTSCRKVHGGGRDGLSLADPIIASRFAPEPQWQPQPHLLVMSGDQIYADEVASPLAPRIARIAADLVGIDESDVFGAAPLIGGRQAPTEAFGFTSSAAANHLWSYGEYLAMYLLGWSPVLWSSSLPEYPMPSPFLIEVDDSVTKDDWDEELASVQRFRTTLPAVARVLANVPSLTMCDDHEITDDWNLDYDWAAAVYATSTGRRCITNGMIAYVLCQHWGNAPARFSVAGSPEAGVLQAVETAVVAGQSPAPGTATLLGIPMAPPVSRPPPAIALRDLTDPAAIRYDLTVDPDDGWPIRIVLLDERTAREFTRTDNQAARISRAALALQLPPPSTPAALTVVVTPAPVLGSDLVENVIQPLLGLVPHGAEFADYESWSAVPANHQDLLQRLAAHDPVVILSGDVHYGFTARLTRSEAGTTTHAAQLTSSAAKNLETKNAAISLFSELIMRLGLERAREESGYTSLPAVDRAAVLAPPPVGAVLPWDDTVDVLLGRVARRAVSEPAVLASDIVAGYGLSAPDWTYRVEPIDDDEHGFTGAPAVPAPWLGWQPDNSLAMADGLQRADLHRIARMFVGLPHVAVISFSTAGSQVTVHQELRCPIGDADAPDNTYVLATNVALA
jgi:hypothetical protein